MMTIIESGVNGRVCDYWAALDELHSRGWLVPNCPLVEALNDVNDGATPLHIAAVLGDEATVQGLLDAGADPNAVTFFDGWTPLSCVCRKLVASQQMQAVALALVAGGADCLCPIALGSRVSILERVWRGPVKRFMLQHVYEQQRQRGMRRSPRLVPAASSAAPDRFTTAQLLSALRVAASDADERTAMFFWRAWREAMQQEQQQQEQQQQQGQQEQQQQQEQQHRARCDVLVCSTRSSDERVLTALLRAGILAPGQEPDLLTTSLQQVVNHLRCTAAAALLQHVAQVDQDCLASLAYAACVQAGFAGTGPPQAAALQRAECLLRLLLASDPPPVQLGTEAEPASLISCPLHILARQMTDYSLQLASAEASRGLVRLAELLVAAGYRPARFAFYRRTVPLALEAQGILGEVERDVCPFDEVVNSTGGPIIGLLRLAAYQPAWTSDSHSHFPPAFRQAAQTLLLAHRHASTAPAAAAGGSGRGSGWSRAKRRRGAAQVQQQAERPNALALLPTELLMQVIGHAAYPLSAWL
ncbi:hypothetical protein C2E21_5101 [Chlorella sorokiniana]|uniref:Uncharacterized protein n=1 Tax=Chlorella sorokiniana TaxID=3076 RepID=A0A2P6TPX8_CHLSO|nr:hypothetical protein C2E21_5101 [Chlorella sorokiniana]|eukprot:PRW56085.1 hypothetical protein C2E21_5101 [Chlorella sorokiniana]